MQQENKINKKNGEGDNKKQVLLTLLSTTIVQATALSATIPVHQRKIQWKIALPGLIFS